GLRVVIEGVGVQHYLTPVVGALVARLRGSLRPVDRVVALGVVDVGRTAGLALALPALLLMSLLPCDLYPVVRQAGSQDVIMVTHGTSPLAGTLLSPTATTVGVIDDEHVTFSGRHGLAPTSGSEGVGG